MSGGYLVKMGGQNPRIWRITAEGMRRLRGKIRMESLIKSKFPFRARLVLTLTEGQRAGKSPMEQAGMLWAAWANLRKIWDKGTRDRNGKLRRRKTEYIAGIHDDRDDFLHLDLCITEYFPKKLLAKQVVKAGFGQIKWITGITGKPGSPEWEQAVRYCVRYTFKGRVNKIEGRRYIGMSAKVSQAIRDHLQAKKPHSERQWQYMEKETVAVINERTPVEVVGVDFRRGGLLERDHLHQVSGRWLNLDPEKMTKARNNLKWIMPKPPKPEKTVASVGQSPLPFPGARWDGDRKRHGGPAATGQGEPPLP